MVSVGWRVEEREGRGVEGREGIGWGLWDSANTVPLWPDMHQITFSTGTLFHICPILFTTTWFISKDLCNARYIQTSRYLLVSFFSFLLQTYRMPSHEPNEAPNNKHDFEIRATKVILSLFTLAPALVVSQQYYSSIDANILRLWIVLRPDRTHPPHPGYTKNTFDGNLIALPMFDYNSTRVVHINRTRAPILHIPTVIQP